MGSRVAEILVAEHPVPMEFVGVDDRFGQSGTPAELLIHYGMSSDAIRTAVLRAAARKPALH
jgi:transketolase